MIVCTHILPDVQAVSDSVVILVNGKVRVSDRLENLSQPETPGVEVSTVGSPALLRQTLHGRGIGAELTEDGRLSVSGDGDATLAAVWTAARESSTLIRSIRPARNSMEAIFLDAVRGSNRADS